MKKNLVRIFSLVLAVATSLSVSAAPAGKKVATGASERHGMLNYASPVETKAPNGLPVRPRHSRGVNANPFAKPFKAGKPVVKAPLKEGAQAEPTGRLPQFIGSVLNYEANGLYKIPTNSSMKFERLAGYAFGANGAVLIGENYITCEDFTNPVYGQSTFFTGYNVMTGQESFDIQAPYFTYSMTVDETTSTVYGITNIENYNTLAKINIDPAHNAVTFDAIEKIYIEEFGMWNALACDGNGQLYGILTLLDEEEYANENFVSIGSALYKIDKETAQATRIGETGYDSLYPSDATFDTKTNRLYWTVCNSQEQGYFTEVNTTTGAATILYHFPGNEDVAGLCVLPPEAENGAPDVVTDLKVNFPNGTITGSIDFKAPATLFDGTAGSGSMNYTVLANGQTVATGTAAYGAEVAAPVTLKQAGFYTFIVYASNAVGDGPKAEIKEFVGTDTPVATTVTASWDNDVMTVTWLPVTTTINGGYIDVDNVTYTVTRYPGAEVVAKDLKATTFTENLPRPASLVTYYYTVVANAGGLTSQPAQSNEVSLGSLVPPFSADFEDGLCGFTVIDANGDGASWKAHDGRVRIQFDKNNDMDDWLISPGFTLTGGKLYDVAAALACGNPQYVERIEIKVGKAVSPEAMLEELLAPTEITLKVDAPYEWSSSFVPETDGVYYIGFHAISDKNTFLLYVDNFSISSPKVAESPAAVTDLVVTPGLNGVLNATATFTTPAKSLSGNDLTSLTKVELLRGTTVVKTWESPAVNTELTYTDNVEKSGDYNYTVVAYNDGGASPETTVPVYIGVDFPAKVQDVSVFQTEKPGEVTLYWSAVTSTASGAELDWRLVKYQILRLKPDGSFESVSPMLETTSYTYQAVPEGQQEFLQYIIYPVTERGLGSYGVSNFIPAGTPYNGLYLTDEFDYHKYIFGQMGTGEWSMWDDNLVPSQDGDDRLFAMFGRYEDTYSELYTGLISLDGMKNPTVSLYTYNIYSQGELDYNELTISARELGVDEYTHLKTVVINETGPGNTWNRVVADLSEFEGQVVQVSIKAVSKTVQYTIIDNLKIGDMPQYDLVLRSVNPPARAVAGDNITVSVKVENEGSLAASNYTVELYGDDDLLESKTGETIEPGKNAVIDFDVTVPPFAKDDVYYSAKIVFAPDENTDNNIAAGATMDVSQSRLPAATDLEGVLVTNEVKLTWNKPDLKAIPADPVTDDFEDGISFSSHYGNWTFVDVDNSPVGSFQDVNVPNIVSGVTKGSFWIWDVNKAGNVTYFGAHSGSKYLFSLFRDDKGTSNEWAISPELDGSAQTISFYARSYHPTDTEKMKIAYSTGSLNPSDFIVAKEVSSVPFEWTYFEIEVPAGTKHFAINSCATYAYMLMIDDVTFIPAGAPVTNEFKGYDVYRDGVKINDAMLTETGYTDRNIAEGHTYNYTVVALYAVGQSPASNVATVNYNDTGIDNVYGDQLTISTVRNAIVVTGAAGQAVAAYAVDGKTIFSGMGKAKTVIPAQPGVYVVKAGQTVKKVLVK
ncbi:MAG: choice-of-anchor J domain-containing protein [Duncaniella sp.]|nr:choice-of-anchor J domain-containing protein [Duncaniella sp.]